jgi:hypothetical protein
MGMPTSRHKGQYLLNVIELESYSFQAIVSTEISGRFPSHKSKGGPDALIDHQMVMDEQTDSLYVYGGMNGRTRNYSGMHRYEIS